MLWWQLRQLRSKNPNTRRKVANELGKSRDARAVEALVAALSDGSEDVRKTAADALESIDPTWAKSEAGKQAIPTLVGALEDRSESVMRTAAGVLGRIGDTRAVEPLVAALAAEDSQVRQAAADALERIDSNWAKSEAAKQAVPALLSCLTGVRRLQAKSEQNISDIRRDKGSWESSAHEVLAVAGAKQAVPNLAAALKERVSSALHALDVLGKIGDAQAVEPLVAVLTNKDSHLRKAAAATLRAIDPNWAKSEAAKRAIPTLVGTLKNSSESVREAAAGVLGKIGDTRAVEPLVAALAAEDLQVQHAVRVALDRFVPNWAKSEAAKQAVPTLVAGLSRRGDKSSRDAAYVLGEIGDVRAVEPLVVALADKDVNMRGLAERALCAIDPNWTKSEAAQRAVPALVSALVNGDSDTGRAAEDALGRIDPNWAKSEAAKQAVPNLLATLRRRGSGAPHAADVLGKISDARAAEPLVEALAAIDSADREAAATALDRFVPNWAKSEAAKQAVPTLVAALKQRGNEGPRHAAKVLGKIGDVRAVEPLVAALADEHLSADWRREAAIALEKIGDVQAVEPLVEALADKHSDVRREAAIALRGIDQNWAKSEAAQRAVPALVRALVNGDSDVPQAAEDALDRIDPNWADSEAAKERGVKFCKHDWIYDTKVHHRCSLCFARRWHVWDVRSDERGYGHGCSKCGYCEQDGIVVR